MHSMCYQQDRIAWLPMYREYSLKLLEPLRHLTHVHTAAKLRCVAHRVIGEHQLRTYKLIDFGTANGADGCLFGHHSDSQDVCHISRCLCTTSPPVRRATVVLLTYILRLLIVGVSTTCAAWLKSCHCTIADTSKPRKLVLPLQIFTKKVLISNTIVWCPWKLVTASSCLLASWQLVRQHHPKTSGCI
jgi:hypothetical protein